MFKCSTVFDKDSIFRNVNLFQVFEELLTSVPRKIRHLGHELRDVFNKLSLALIYLQLIDYLEEVLSISLEYNYLLCLLICRLIWTIMQTRNVDVWVLKRRPVAERRRDRNLQLLRGIDFRLRPVRMSFKSDFVWVLGLL